MVLVVISYVETNPVEASVIRVRFLSLDEDVMFRDEVSSDGVQSTSKDDRSSQISEGLGSESEIDENIEDNNSSPVNSLPKSRLLRLDEKRSNGIEDWLQNDPDDLQKRVREKFSLPSSRHIHIDSVNSLILMMLHVILLKHREMGNDRSGIGKYSKNSVV